MSQGPPPTPKMSKFLRPEWRDRPRSSSGDGGVTSSSESPARISRIIGKKGSKLFGKNKDEDRDNNSAANQSLNNSSVGISDPPVIIEPPSNSKPRARPPRPSNASDNPSAPDSNIVASSTSAPSGSSSGSVRNMGDLPSRLSGWFSQAFSGSSTDLSLPNILSSSNLSASQVLAGSPKSKPSNPLITAAKQGKDHLDKAMRYLLDSDAQPDKSTDKIWLLGVEHPGYEPPPPPSSMPSMGLAPSSPTSTLSPPGKRNHRRDSTDSRAKSPSSFRSPIPFTHSNASTHSLSSALSSSSTVNPNTPSSKTGVAWPAAFYSDYTSRVWLTYRNAFPPIRDSSLASLEPIPSSSTQGSVSSTDISAPLPSPLKSKWPWGTEKGWTSDAGWGCMLRTGQSLLANALIHLHLSRSWRRPTQSSFSPEYVQYIRILTWFLDTPSPQSPFGVHRMALAGKELGKEVGSWFGPSTAAGAIKRLVGEFEDAGLEVAVAVDSVVYQSDVYAASCAPRGPHAATAANGSKASSVGASKHHGKKAQHPQKWGDRAVLVLVGIRLGIDGVNPIYYDSVKALFTFPQSVGIAGGRPSSSYYFVGTQGDSLFYLDPHHTRPAVPLRPPPSLSTFDEISMASTDDGLSQASSRLGKRRGSDFKHSHTSTPDTSESDRRSSKRLSIRRASLNRISSYQQQQAAAPTSPSSVHSSSSMSQPSSAISVTGGSHAHSQSHSSYSGHSTIPLSSSPLARTSMPPSSHRPTSASPTRVGSSSASPLSPSSSGFPQSPSTASSTGMGIPVSPAGSVSTLDPLSAFMATAYSLSELRTFHCERVRKMPLSGLDPSMLLGFLCRDEKDWKDLRARVADMAKTKKAIFSIQDEPPVWPDDDDDDLDLESASSDQDAEEVESPIGGDDELDDNELEIKPQSEKSEPAKVDAEKDGDDEDDDDDDEDGLSVVTPIQPSTKFATSRHDTIIGRARPEMAAAAAAASKTVASQHHDRKDSRENDGDDDGEEDDDDEDDDDDDWVDPIKPSPPLTAPASSAPTSEHKKTSSANGSAYSESSDSGSRIRGRDEDASITPRPASVTQQTSSSSVVTVQQQPRQRPTPKDLPAIPTTIVSMPREPSSRPSSIARGQSQTAISDAPVPFPTRSTDHRKQSSASSRSATSSSNPTSPLSSPASQHPGHATSNSTSTSNSHPHVHYRQQSSAIERDATGYPFPGSMTDESGTTSSDSGPSSDAWGGNEKSGARLVPKRERRTTVGRTSAHSPTPVSEPTPTLPPPNGNGNTQPHGVERVPSVGKAKHGGRTTSGGVRAAVWKDEDGDDF